MLRTLLLIVGIYTCTLFSVQAQMQIDSIDPMFHKASEKSLRLRKLQFPNIRSGFILGTNKSWLSVDLAPRVPGDSLVYANGYSKMGIELGLMGEYVFNPRWSLRLSPTISFQEHYIQFHYNHNGNVTDLQQRIDLAYLDVPLHLKLSTKRTGKLNYYWLFGGKTSYNLHDTENVDNTIRPFANQAIIKTKFQFWSADLGVGTSIVTKHNKLSFELKYSHGLNNILFNDGTFYSRSMSGLRTKMLTFTLIIQ